MDDPTPSRRMTRGLSRALSSAAAALTPKTGTQAPAATAALPRAALGERTNTGGGASAPAPAVSRPAFSPLLPGAETTPPLRLAPDVLASPPGPRLPFAGEVEAAAGPPPPPSAAIPPALLRRAEPFPSTLADLLASPYTPIGDDGSVGGREGGTASASPPASIPAHWPRPGEREAAARAYSGDGGGGAGGAGPSTAAAAAASFPPKAVVARVPTPEEAGTDRDGVAALQAEVRRALTSVGVVVPPPPPPQPYRPPARRAAAAGGGEGAAAASGPTPRRLTALEAALGGLGLGTPGVRRRRGGGA